MVFDPLDGFILLYGGWNNVSNYLGDTWIFSHSSWVQLNPSVNPGRRSDVSMAYDPVDGYVLLFGGDNGTSQLNDTWGFQGGAWMREQTTTAPLARQDASMVYDSGDGYTLLFGGVNKAPSSNIHYYNDTWSYKAGQWTMLTTAQAPSPRGAHGMVYDQAAGYTLMFGGSIDYYSVNGGQSDTWKYQRGAWSEIYPSGSPDHRYSFGLVWDPAIAGDLFYGGWDPSGVCGNEQNDTRIYKQGGWRQLRPVNDPGERQGFGIDYDPVSGAVILFGGQENPGASPEAGCGTAVFLNDTWQYSFATSPINNPENGPSLSSPSYLMYGIVCGVVVAGSSVGAYEWRRRSKGKKNQVPGEAKTGLICQKCGASLPDDSAYCGKCGRQLEP
jgi:zinc-ribbon domain